MRERPVTQMKDEFPRIMLNLAGRDVRQLRKHMKDYPEVLEAMGLDKTESDPEQLLWAAINELDLPELAGIKPQHWVMSFRLDFALVDEKIGVEVDSFEHHSDPKSFRADLRRHRWIESLGWRMIRFAASEVYEDPQKCVREMVSLVCMFRRRAAA